MILILLSLHQTSARVSLLRVEIENEESRMRMRVVEEKLRVEYENESSG